MNDHVLYGGLDPSWTIDGLVSLYCMFLMHTSSLTFPKAVLDVIDIGRSLRMKKTC